MVLRIKLMTQAFAFKNSIEHGSLAAEETVCKVISRIQKSWQFTNAQMARLLHTRANTYGLWLKKKRIALGKPPFTADMQVVISLIAIHRSLTALMQNPKDQVLWLSSPHPDFNGVSPLEFAKHSCANLFYLKSYLDYLRGLG